MKSRVLLICAAKNTGKTTYLQHALKTDPWRSLKVAGMLSLSNTAKSEYTLYDLVTGEQRLALSAERAIGEQVFGRYWIDTEAYRWANEQMLAALPSAALLLFDEIGKLELAGSGFLPAFAAALARKEGQIVASVRTEALRAVQAHFGLAEATVRRVVYE
ncbi:MAG TPA: nucleoside-triphosphatase [Sphaerochaeta sp.]|nr:nucleoside-triphosphatase [Sphaerochaeta sp.]